MKKFSWRVRSMLAVAMLVGGASTAHAGGFLWWCYNGNCCEESGGSVTTNCQFGCNVPDGENNAITIVFGC